MTMMVMMMVVMMMNGGSDGDDNDDLMMITTNADLGPFLTLQVCTTWPSKLATTRTPARTPTSGCR